MDAVDVCVVSSRDGRGGLVVRVGIPLADVYLEFLGGRCRPNTVLAAAYDLKVFFTVVARPPDQVRPADVLAFITAQRTGRGGDRALQPAGLADEPGEGEGEGEAAGAAQARGKWLTASVADDIPAVIAAASDEAERRDPQHKRERAVLIDGNNTQIEAVTAEDEAVVAGRERSAICNG